MKYHLTKSKTIVIEHDVVTLEEIINELQNEKILSDDLNMKKVRKILRKDKLLSDMKLHNHYWIWDKELKDDVKTGLSNLLSEKA